MKKVDEFKILLLEEDYDIVFVTESPKTINVFRECLGAQLTICAQK